MIALLVPIFAALSVLLVGSAVMLAHRSRRRRIAARLALGDFSAASPAGSSRIMQVLIRLGKLSGGGKTSGNLRAELASAGFHNANASAIFIGAKAGLFVITLVGVLLLASALNTSFRQTLLLIMVVCGIAFFLPNLVVESRRRVRRLDISRHLPDAIDLLEISVTAGMGLDQAWNAVADQVRAVSSNLADEMALTNLEIHLGASRPDALRHMAARTGAAELGSLVACLVQAERFGTSVRQALRNFATDMRESRSQIAQETAEKMAIKLLFPMILFVFPPAVMVMAGPAFITLTRALKGTIS
jgi:tight adherence protein C